MARQDLLLLGLSDANKPARQTFWLAGTLGLTCLFLQTAGVAAQSTVPNSAKPTQFHVLRALICPGGYSEVSAVGSARNTRLVSNVDFRVFDPSFVIDTPATTHCFLFFTFTLADFELYDLQQAGQLDARGLPKD